MGSLDKSCKKKREKWLKSKWKQIGEKETNGIFMSFFSFQDRFRTNSSRYGMLKRVDVQRKIIDFYEATQSFTSTPVLGSLVL
jgi:hypothetical protein